jgi:hypothetical protein
MGLENKIICEWLPGSRFWPSYVHQLRSVNFPHVRFYVPGGIFRRADVDILVAHLPPPWAYELESMSEAQVQQLVLDVLSDMFSTELNGGPVRPKSSERYAPMEDVDTNAEPASAGIALEQFSDEDDEQFYARKEEHSRQLKARKELRRTGKRQDAEARRDEVWRRKPVVAPHSITVTRWSDMGCLWPWLKVAALTNSHSNSLLPVTFLTCFLAGAKTRSHWAPTVVVSPALFVPCFCAL